MGADKFLILGFLEVRLNLRILLPQTPMSKIFPLLKKARWGWNWMEHTSFRFVDTQTSGPRLCWSFIDEKYEYCKERLWAI